MNYYSKEPIVAVATPMSPAALAIVRTSGAGSIALVAKVFSRPKALLEAPGNTAVYGYIELVQKATAKVERLDEVVATVYRAPHSFTGEESVELSMHGSPYIVTSVYKLLLEIGFKAALPGEFSFRAFINGKVDLTQAQAIQCLCSSKTHTASKIAMANLTGKLKRKLDEIKHSLVQFLATVEVAIEYPEDEEAIQCSSNVSALYPIKEQLNLLLDSYKMQRIYEEGASIVLCGRTNAGKSSLFNALLHTNRAIVSPVAGTTRDYLEGNIVIGDIPIKLYDTAGLRATCDSIEKEGIARSFSLIDNARLVLYVVDATKLTLGASEGIEDANFIKEYTQKHKAEDLIIVLNKCDLVKEIAPSGIYSAGYCISCKSLKGMFELVARIESLLKKDIHSEEEGATLNSIQQRDAIKQALSSIEHAIEAAPNYSGDAIAFDIEEALHYIGEVTGEVTPNDILQEVFSNFCVGK